MAVSTAPTSARCVGVLAPRSHREALQRQLAAWAGVEWHERADSLVEHVAGHEGVDAVIVELDDEVGRSIAATVVEIAAGHPRLPIIVYDRLDGATLGALLAVSGLGLRVEYVIRPHERVDSMLRRVTSSDYRPGVTPLLLHRFVPSAPRALRLFTAVAALAAPARHALHEISRRCSVSPRTIERRLERARWPVAHVVLQSFVALDAVWLMTEYGWSARRVQAVRRLPHASSVTRLLTRYAGVSPATLREDGGFVAALEHVTRVLSVGRVS